MTTILRTTGRSVAGTVLLAVSTAVAYHAWLGWGWVGRHRPDTVTGSLTTASEWWQPAGFLVTLAVLATVAAWRVPAWVPVVTVPPVALVVFSANQSTEDALWAIAAYVFVVVVVVVTGVPALVTAVVRRSRERSAAGA